MRSKEAGTCKRNPFAARCTLKTWQRGSPPKARGHIRITGLLAKQGADKNPHRKRPEHRCFLMALNPEPGHVDCERGRQVLRT